MKKTFTTLVFAMIVSLFARMEANPVDKATAASLAAQVLNKNVIDATPSQFTGCRLFTGADGKGFVLIADDDRIRPVLAYSPDGSFDPAAMPEHVAYWIIANEDEATLQVIDVNGRILSSETINGSVSKAINAAPGVYVIRLVNSKNVKTQKIVVR